MKIDTLSVYRDFVRGLKYTSLGDSDFDLGQPLMFVGERPTKAFPDGYITVRNWAGDKIAGYIGTGQGYRVGTVMPSDREGKALRKAAQEDLKAISVHFDTKRDGTRTSMSLAIFRPGRILDTESIPLLPSIMSVDEARRRFTAGLEFE